MFSGYGYHEGSHLADMSERDKSEKETSYGHDQSAGIGGGKVNSHFPSHGARIRPASRDHLRGILRGGRGGVG